MARDNRIDRAERDPEPEQPAQDLTTSERVKLMVSSILNNVGERLEEKRMQPQKTRKR